MDRRSFLATIGVGVSGSLVGCVQAPGIPGSDLPAGSSATADSSGTDGTTEMDDSSTVNEPPHDLVVENHTDTTLTAHIRLAEKNGDTLVEDRFELPHGRGIEFDDIAAWERTYTIELAIDGGEIASFSWHTDECGPAEESPGSGGSRNATVRIEPDPEKPDERQISMVVDQCDALYGPELPTGPADGFRVED